MIDLKRPTFPALIWELRKHFEQSAATWDEDCPCGRGQKTRGLTPCTDCIIDELVRRGISRDLALEARCDLAEIRDRQRRFSEKIQTMQETVQDSVPARGKDRA
ncbi:hypothetical protein TK90_2643 (plasmid) [Thioalkalivibrio sp. K90mix]|uniref:hypothetical protein n=1 Tax=Thioalkalivibrio sp. (strain K90mix) TaxID=396595 RepID=UPI000195AB9F|nr:hypothetical protein [Thioalkalivibrio sp. K90mix]ADC73130.1 hypothetical protein TK90_2643 [Thioalkalivibrio sp. K90mix]